MTRLIFCFLLCLTYVVSTSQTIKGTVTDSLGTISHATIIVKKTSTSNVVLQFTTSDKNGNFSLPLNEKSNLIFLEFKSLVHEPKVIEIDQTKSNFEDIQLNVFLEARTTAINEVIINSKKPIQIQKDTITFDPTSFKDGSERVVEDLLKKLPGVEVKSDGSIEYKGKSIQALLLDGDNLFDSQYKIGSKNINVDMIEKVQGIDKYEENSLLKGINESDEVAINLVLKKGKTDLSATAQLGYGNDNRQDNSVSAILVNQKVKGFGLFSYNNIGVNNTPYNSISNFQSFDNISEQHAKTILEQGNFSSFLDAKHHHFNSNLFLSGNVIFKLHTKSLFKINLGIYDDRISRNNQSDSKFTIDKNQFTINETNALIKKPTLYDVKVFYSNKERSKFHWDYLLKLNHIKTVFTDQTNNNGNLQDNSVDTENLYVSQNINTTFKITDKTVLVTKLEFSKSDAPQKLSIYPGTEIAENLLITHIQNSKFDKQFLHLKSTLLSSLDNLKFGIHAAFLSTNSKLKSSLNNYDNISLGSLYENSNSYSINNYNIKPVVLYQKKNYSLRISIDNYLTLVRFEDFISDKNNNKTDWITMPELYFNYKLNDKNTLSTSYEYNAILPEENKLYTGIIQTNYRSFSNNSPSLQYLKSNTYRLSYNYNDPYNYQFFSANLTHNYKPNNFFSNTYINEDTTVNNSFYHDLNSKEYELNFSGEMYFHDLRTTFKLRGNFINSFNKNIVNNSEIRNIKNHISLLNFFARTKISHQLNLENQTTFIQNSIKTTGFATSFKSLNHQTKIVFNTSEDFKIFTIGNLIIPDMSQKNNYIFLECELNYTPTNQKFTIGLIAKNLTNHKKFTTRNISDFSTTNNSHQLIERYFMLKTSFTF